MRRVRTNKGNMLIFMKFHLMTFGKKNNEIRHGKGELSSC